MDTMRAKLFAAVALALLVAPYFLSLGHPHFWDANESLYAEPPRECLETGNWLVPTMNYKPWFVKPPGVSWAIIPFYAALGPSELSERLPMALAAALTILLTFLIGRKLGGSRAGWLSAAILATMPKNFMFSRQLAGDVFLTTVFAVAAWGYLDWFLSEGRRRRGLWLAALALGAGTLMKGPVALILAAAVPIGHLLLAGRRDMFRKLRPWVPAALALAIAAPWFVYMSLHFGRFVDVYFLEHHFDRAFTGMFGDRGILFYPIALLGDALPWSVVLPAVLVATIWEGRRGEWRRDPRFPPLLWCVIVVGFFSLSAGKRSVYLMPMYPAAAILVGITVDRLAARRNSWSWSRWFVYPLLASAVVVAASCAAIWFGFPRFGGVVAIALVPVVVWVVLLAASARRRSLLLACCATFLVLFVLAVYTVFTLPRLEPYQPSRDFAEQVAKLAGPKDRSGRYHVRLQSLTFYGRRPFFSLRVPADLKRICATSPHTFVVIPKEYSGIVTRDPALRTKVLAKRMYLTFSLPGLLGERDLRRPLLLLEATPRATVRK